MQDKRIQEKSKVTMHERLSINMLTVCDRYFVPLASSLSSFEACTSFIPDIHQHGVEIVTKNVYEKDARPSNFLPFIGIRPEGMSFQCRSGAYVI